MSDLDDLADAANRLHVPVKRSGQVPQPAAPPQGPVFVLAPPQVFKKSSPFMAGLQIKELWSRR
jgi:hypothetical protein